MTTLAMAPALLAALALGACSSDDDTPPDPTGTSQEAPGTGEPEGPPSSTPGGDTSTVAGLWNATEVVTVTDGAQSTTGDDVAYVQISADGLWTVYDYDADIAGSPGQGNCYRVIGPRTLTPESGDEYSLAGEEEPLTLGIDAAGDTLTVDFGGERAVQQWPRTDGEVSVEDFDECTAAPGVTDPGPGDR